MMTVILAYCNEDCSIVMSDKRLNIGKNQGNGFIDNAQKLNEFGAGWASGSGLYEVANRVIHYLKTDKGNLIDSYRHSIKEMKNGNPDLIEEIDNTIILISTLDSTKKFSLYSLRNGHIQGLKKERIIIVYPEDFSHVKEFEERYVFEFNKEIGLPNILYQMMILYKEICEKSNYVSNTCDIGITFKVNEKFSTLKKCGSIIQLIEQLKNNKF